MSKRPSMPLFLPLLALYPVLFLVSANPGQIRVASALAVGAAALVISTAIYAIANLFAKSRTGAALGVVVLVVMFFAYGTVSARLDTIAVATGLGDAATPNVLDMHEWSRPLIAIIWAALAIWALVRVARADWPSQPHAHKAANFAAAALTLLSVVPMATRAFVSTDSAAAGVVQVGTRQTAASATSLPDVYFIVMDGYARADVLDHYYGYDNEPFISALRARGFVVPNRTSANYNWTFLSLASTLNMDYVQPLFGLRISPYSTDRAVVYEGIRNSTVAKFLREKGYRVLHLQSTWGATANNPYADRQLRCQTGMYADEFVRSFVEMTWLSAFHSRAGVDLASCHLANFELLGGVAVDPGPKFVFAHFLLPHHPYLFDADGNVLRNAVVSNQFEFQKRLWEDKRAYVSQMQFLNGKVLATIDRLLATSEKPPIIVLESDHGPNLADGLKATDQIALRLANFGAYYLPGAPGDLMPAEGTAVNQFRRIFSHYFGAGLEPLPDRHFVSPYGRPYFFREMPHEMLEELWTRIDSGQQAQLVASNASGREDSK
jgi:hypothetical protein